MPDDALAFASAYEVRRLLDSRQVSSMELTELFLRRIENLDPKLNAYLTVTADLAMDQARIADEATARGESLGALHGIPISIKDLESTKGVRTTFGSLPFKDYVPDRDSVVVERTKAAGAVILGKTNTPRTRVSGDDGEPPWRALPQPLESGADFRRFQRRRGCGRCLRPVHSGDGQRRRGLHQDARQLLRRLRNKA